MNEKIFYGGDIITMENTSPEAICIGDGIIKAIGTLDEMRHRYPKAELLSLSGRTIMPSFIDSHSHITAYAQSLAFVNLSHCKSFGDITDKICNYINKSNISASEWVIGLGYDHNQLIEKRHPDKKVIDIACDENPVMICHKSGNMGVVNSIGLKRLNITSETRKTDGGHIGREGKEPDGYLEENAFVIYSKDILNISDEKKSEFLEKAQKIYLSNGITTIQDGLTGENEWKLLYNNREKLIADIVCYIDMKKSAQLLKENSRFCNNYKNHLKIGGYKIILDSLPQGGTTCMKTSYEGNKPCFGSSTYSDSKVLSFMQKSMDDKSQLLVHCNGDASCEQMIRCYEKLNDKNHIILPVMIHSQLLTDNQLVMMKKLGITPSFFVDHAFQCGDTHIENLGMERYLKISPLNMAFQLGIKPTIHQDSPILEPNMFKSIWCAVNRRTKSGVLLDADERITVYEALKCVTVNAALQYGEIESKGTIAAGKKADLIVINSNPLKCDLSKLKKIAVTITIKDGKCIKK